MTRYMSYLACGTLLSIALALANVADAQTSRQADESAGLTEVADCTAIRNDAIDSARSASRRLRDAGADARREIMLDLLTSADAVALLPCLLTSNETATTRSPNQNVFSMRTREVGTEGLNDIERARLLRTLTYIEGAGVSSADDADCTLHEDGGITCLLEDAWICWCDPPGTDGGECGCADF